MILERELKRELEKDSKDLMMLELAVDGDPDGGEPNEPDNSTEKTYSQSDLDRLINKAIETNTKNMEKKYSSIIEAEKTNAAKEAEKLAKMTAQEKAQAKFDKEKSEFEAQLKEFNRLKMENECVKILNENSLPIEFAKYLTAVDADGTKANIDEFKELFTAALDSAIAGKLKKENKPGVGNTNPQTIDLNKMSYSERVELANTNPDLYRQLKNK